MQGTNFCFPFLLRWASGSYPTELNASICHFGTRISHFTGPREKATFLFLDEARNWLFGFRFFLAVKRPPCLDPWHVFSLSGSRPLPLLGCFFPCCKGSKTRQSPSPTSGPHSSFCTIILPWPVAVTVYIYIYIHTNIHVPIRIYINTPTH